MNGQYSKNNNLGQLAIVLHAHLPYVRKNEKNSLEEDWLFQAILECYIPLPVSYTHLTLPTTPYV